MGSRSFLHFFSNLVVLLFACKDVVPQCRLWWLGRLRRRLDWSRYSVLWCRSSVLWHLLRHCSSSVLWHLLRHCSSSFICSSCADRCRSSCSVLRHILRHNLWRL